ncbi:MAG: ATP-binding protein [Gammaproteobacteria bacterium]
MGLRLKLNLLLSLIFITTLGVGSTILLNVLQHGVAEELTASVDQAARLISVVVNQLPVDLPDAALERTITDISSIGSTRHLRVSTEPSTEAVFNSAQLLAPQWFFDLLAPEPIGLLRVIDLRSKRRQVHIRADATAEINEAWREAVPLFLTLVLFGLLANGLIYITVGRSLSALERVGDALQGISEGDFSIDVPLVGVSDIDRISQRVNELSTALQHSRAEAQSLTRRSLTIQEQERRELSQALHDELGQSINAIQALGVSIQQRVGNSPEISSSVKSIIDVSREMYGRVRDMMSLLRPSVLDELGLRLALQNMVDDWNSYHKDTFCRLDMPATLPNFDENFAINLFRIVQEALTNVAKHAQASEVDVSLELIEEADRGRVDLMIADNGRGFDVARVTKGLGIHGIGERINALGGTWALDSSDAGTRYKISIPIPPSATG